MQIYALFFLIMESLELWNKQRQFIKSISISLAPLEDIDLGFGMSPR